MSLWTYTTPWDATTPDDSASSEAHFICEVSRASDHDISPLSDPFPSFLTWR